MLKAQRRTIMRKKWMDEDGMNSEDEIIA